jgi:outer membrane receptor protein involved in Fe transport
MYQNNKQTSDLNPSTVPDYMFKLGTGYTWDYGTASVFYSYFAKPPRLASEVVVNPEPDALNLLSFNLCIDPSRWLNIPKGRASLTFRIENLFDEDIWVPEFNRGGNPNSLPDGPGRTFYGGLTVNF